MPEPAQEDAPADADREAPLLEVSRREVGHVAFRVFPFPPNRRQRACAREQRPQRERGGNGPGLSRCSWVCPCSLRPSWEWEWPPSPCSWVCAAGGAGAPERLLMNWTVSAAIAMGACVREGRRVPVEAGAAGAALSSLVSISWACGGAGGPRPGTPRRRNVAERTSVSLSSRVGPYAALG